MITEMRDIHFASYTEAAASHFRFSSPALQLSKVETLVGSVFAFFFGPGSPSGVIPTATVGLERGTLRSALPLNERSSL
ncbi:MAG: hypothetical protein AMJ62_14230 [Myxococcales bacterium SG8_38]|nr:MAG: hypothetical protein AMJ62_14230 [Myxococcales bacterium SG8_38]